MTALIRFMRRLGRDRSGISSIEYALLLAFVGGGLVAAAHTLGTAVNDEMEAAAHCIDGNGGPCVF